MPLIDELVGSPNANTKDYTLDLGLNSFPSYSGVMQVPESPFL